MVGVWEALNLGSTPNFFLCFGMLPKIIDVHPKLIPKGGVVQFCHENERYFVCKQIKFTKSVCPTNFLVEQWNQPILIWGCGISPYPRYGRASSYLARIIWGCVVICYPKPVLSTGWLLAELALLSWVAPSTNSSVCLFVQLDAMWDPLHSNVECPEMPLCSLGTHGRLPHNEMSPSPCWSSHSVHSLYPSYYMAPDQTEGQQGTFNSTGVCGIVDILRGAETSNAPLSQSVSTWRGWIGNRNSIPAPARMRGFGSLAGNVTGFGFLLVFELLYSTLCIMRPTPSLFSIDSYFCAVGKGCLFRETPFVYFDNLPWNARI